MAQTKSKINSLEVGYMRVKTNLEVNGTISYGTTTWASATVFNATVTFNTATTFNGPVTVNSTSTFNGPATFKSTTTVQGPFLLTYATLPNTFTATGVAGTMMFRPSTGALLICMSTNSWYQVALSNTTAFN